MVRFSSSIADFPQDAVLSQKMFIMDLLGTTYGTVG
jgi:hypothetical protein